VVAISPNELPSLIVGLTPQIFRWLVYDIASYSHSDFGSSHVAGLTDVEISNIWDMYPFGGGLVDSHGTIMLL
jgi:hypothetical protein